MWPCTSRGRAISSTEGRYRGSAPYVAAFAIGILSSVQARMNGGLAAEWSNPQQAALFSFGSGFLLLTVIALSSRAIRGALARILEALRAGSLRWWEGIGGFLGAFFVLTQSAVVPVVGVAAFTVGIVAGQTSNSLLVDRLGIGPRGRIPVTRRRAIGAGLALVAVASAVGGRLEVAGPSLLALVAAFTAGVLIAFQQAINGRVTVESGQPIAAAWLNFATGTLLLLVVFGVSALTGSSVGTDWGNHPVLYLGGLVGVIFIALAAWTVTKVGVLVTALLSIAGQLVSAVVLDIALPTSGAMVNAALVAGVLLAFAAVFVGARGRSAR